MITNGIKRNQTRNNKHIWIVSKPGTETMEISKSRARKRAMISLKQRKQAIAIAGNTKTLKRQHAKCNAEAAKHHERIQMTSGKLIKTTKIVCCTLTKITKMYVKIIKTQSNYKVIQTQATTMQICILEHRKYGSMHKDKRPHHVSTAPISHGNVYDCFLFHVSA